MDIFKIIIPAMSACFLSILLKQYKPEYAFAVSLSAGIIIFLYVLPTLSSLFASVNSFTGKAKINTVYIKTALKIMGLSYITQYSAELCRDAGENALASKLEMGGKIVMLGASLPIAEALFNLIEGILP